MLARLFVQDIETQSLRWVDVPKGLEAKDVKVREIAGFKALDAKKQRLVQMEQAGGVLVVGVRDEEKGKLGSGWVAIDSGVRYEDHGDHGHWQHSSEPKVVHAKVDAEQGNPAHVYLYDGSIYIANDLKNGYTRLDPEKLLGGSADPGARFVHGGGNHITLAVADGKHGFSAFVDGGGPNKGRVDYTLIGAGSESAITRTFRLPVGGIHGATSAAGKVFFAPAAGIHWINVAESIGAGEVKVHELDLGKPDGGDKPRRTGAFTTHGKNVLFVTGQGRDAKLGMIDAGAAEPAVRLVDMKLAEGMGPAGFEVVKSSKGQLLGFTFHNRKGDAEGQEQLAIFDLDPNRDGDLADAIELKRIPVGPSKVSGHFGHHGITFDADGKRAFFTTPGAGTITVLALADLEPRGEFKIGGTPTHIIAVGGQPDSVKH
jgi:hypothetical protein